MKYYIIAGEASGDLHGANLMKAIVQLDASAEFRFWGGDQMAQIADGLVRHYREIAYMGFIEVIRHLPTILKSLTACKEDILEFRPDALVLIDYPGFNLRIAKWARSQDLNVQYYISPQVWAWKAHRAEIICRAANQLYVILPFEKGFYADRGLEVEYVGHPLLDAIANYEPASDFRSRNGIPETKKLVAVLPGSRKQEVNILLPTMMSLARRHPRHHFVVAGVSTLPKTIYQNHLAELKNVFLIFDQTYDLLSEADSAVVTSGTATLETALFKVPQVVCYRGGVLNYLIARRIVNIEYISLVNLIAEKPVVKELVQHDFTPDKLHEAFLEIQDADHRNKIMQDYHSLITTLGNAGASERTAEFIFNSLCL